MANQADSPKNSHRALPNPSTDPETMSSNDHNKTQVFDRTVADFDGEDDPENPFNWNKRYRWSLVILLSLMTTLVTLATVICAPAAPQILQEFESTNSYDSILLVSIWELGEVFGPLLMAPLSELYGRLWTWHITCGLFVICSAGTALSTSLNMVIAFRFLDGVFTPMVLSAAMTSDVFRREERGRGMAVASFAPLFGPTFGPTVGGYLALKAGWRWTAWVITIAAAVIEVVLLFFLRETGACKILKDKARKLRKQTGRDDIRSVYELDIKPRNLFMRSMFRPLRYLLFSPIVALMSLYTGVIYGYMYLVLTTMTNVLEQTYGFSAGSAGLSFIAMGLGLTCGALVCFFLLDRVVKSQASKSEPLPPESRLPFLFIGSFVTPAGLFLYGWATHNAIHWIAPLVGTFLIGLGQLVTNTPIRTYLADVFLEYAASAIAANIFFRTITGALLPLVAPPLYDNLGLGWGNSLLGFIALALIPLPLVFMKYGARLRARFPMKD